MVPFKCPTRAASLIPPFFPQGVPHVCRSSISTSGMALCWFKGFLQRGVLRGCPPTVVFRCSLRSVPARLPYFTRVSPPCISLFTRYGYPRVNQCCPPVFSHMGSPNVSHKGGCPLEVSQEWFPNCGPTSLVPHRVPHSGGPQLWSFKGCPPRESLKRFLPCQSRSFFQIFPPRWVYQSVVAGRSTTGGQAGCPPRVFRVNPLLGMTHGVPQGVPNCGSLRGFPRVFRPGVVSQGGPPWWSLWMVTGLWFPSGFRRGSPRVDPSGVSPWGSPRGFDRGVPQRGSVRVFPLCGSPSDDPVWVQQGGSPGGFPKFCLPW
jgi:hypothetical protein